MLEQEPGYLDVPLLDSQVKERIAPSVAGGVHFHLAQDLRQALDISLRRRLVQIVCRVQLQIVVLIETEESACQDDHKSRVDEKQSAADAKPLSGSQQDKKDHHEKTVKKRGHRSKPGRQQAEQEQEQKDPGVEQQLRQKSVGDHNDHFDDIHHENLLSCSS